MNANEIRDLLRQMCDAAGSIAAWAAQSGVSKSYVGEILAGRKRAGKSVLEAMGIVSAVAYKKRGRPRIGTDRVSERMSYRSWNQMMQRCENTRNPRYADYGGRGISVCERWRKYQSFVTDMGEPPPGFQIERKNNDEGYNSGNCIWAERKTQQRNQRKTRMVELDGKKILVVEACERYGLNVSSLYNRAARLGETWTEAFIHFRDSIGATRGERTAAGMAKSKEEHEAEIIRRLDLIREDWRKDEIRTPVLLMKAGSAEGQPMAYNTAKKYLGTRKEAKRIIDNREKYRIRKQAKKENKRAKG